MSIRTEQFVHANTTDVAESVITITSTQAEKKKIRAVRIHTESANDGDLSGYVDSKKVLEHMSGSATIRNYLDLPIMADLEVGEKFELTLLNRAAGSDATITGLVEYELI